MWNAPTPETLAQIPTLYSTEFIPLKEKIIYSHFWIGSCDWFCAEFDGDDLMFCFVLLNGNFRAAEWGYVSLSELKEINIDGIHQVDFDIFWTPSPASEIRTICKANGWAISQPNKYMANMTA